MSKNTSGSKDNQPRNDGGLMSWSQSEHRGLYQVMAPHRGSDLSGRVLTTESDLWALKINDKKKKRATDTVVGGYLGIDILVRYNFMTRTRRTIYCVDT